MWADIGLVLGGYLLGSVPHLAFLARLRGLKLGGDFHQGLWEKAGHVTAMVGILGEFAKGAIPVLVGRWLQFEIGIIALAGLAAVCGQMWPVFSGFDGEKGNSIAIAMLAALAPYVTLIALIPVIISLIFRTVPRLAAVRRRTGETGIIGGGFSKALPVGMFVCFLAVPFIGWYLGEPPSIIWVGAALFVAIMVRRLTAGLKTDLAESRETGRVLLRRLFYDRSTVAWRDLEK